MARKPQSKLAAQLQHVLHVAITDWLPLLYQVSLVGVLIVIGNVYAAYHHADLRGFLLSGTPLPSWTYVGDRSTAMLVEAFIGASIGVTIRWIILSLDRSPRFTLSRYLRGWVADFVLAPFIVVILLTILRSPSLNFGDNRLSLDTADIGIVWALAAIAGYFSSSTQSTFIELGRRLLKVSLVTENADPAVPPGREESVSRQNRAGYNSEVSTGTEEHSPGTRKNSGPAVDSAAGQLEAKDPV